MTISNIVIADAQATPVNHTYVPVGRDAKNVFVFETQAETNLAGRSRITVEVKRPPVNRQSNGSERNYRVVLGLHRPVLEVPGTGTTPFVPAPTVAYVPRGFTEYILSERATDQDRDDLSKMMPLLLQNAQIRAVVEDLAELIG